MATATRRAIYGRLSGDTTLNNLLGTPPSGWTKSIYHNQAPANATFPLVIFFKSSGVPTDAFQKPGAFETEVWTVKAVDRATSADPAETVAARVKALLNDATLSISGATHLYLRRQSDIEYPEIVDGVTHHHVGSLYRLIFE